MGLFFDGILILLNLLVNCHLNGKSTVRALVRHYRLEIVVIVRTD